MYGGPGYGPGYGPGPGYGGPAYGPSGYGPGGAVPPPMGGYGGPQVIPPSGGFAPVGGYGAPGMGMGGGQQACFKCKGSGRYGVMICVMLLNLMFLVQDVEVLGIIQELVF